MNKLQYMENCVESIITEREDSDVELYKAEEVWNDPTMDSAEWIHVSDFKERLNWLINCMGDACDFENMEIDGECVNTKAPILIHVEV